MTTAESQNEDEKEKTEQVSIVVNNKPVTVDKHTTGAGIKSAAGRAGDLRALPHQGQEGDTGRRRREADGEGGREVHCVPVARPFLRTR